MTKPHIAIVTHALGSPVRGNGTTVARWMGALIHRGYTVEAVLPGHKPTKSPDIVHGYHALHGGVWAGVLATSQSTPLVVSLAGTDVYSLVEGHSDATTLRDVLSRAHIVTAAFGAFGLVLPRDVHASQRFLTVRRGVYLEAKQRPPRAPGPLRVMLVAGLRPVKDPLFALALASSLRRRGLSMSLRIVGPTLDEEYAARVRACAARASDVSLATLSREAMSRAYREADVVWNTSLHEGGSNAALEALSYGCAVALRDVSGNRELASTTDSPIHLFSIDDVGDGAHEEALGALLAFHRAVEREGDVDRRVRWTSARAWLAREHDPETEADELEAAYVVAQKAHP